MSNMDPWLAQVYGTGGGSDDLEKTAQYHLLQKLAEEEGVDLSGLSEEELQALSDEVLSDEGEEQGYEADGEYSEEDLQKEAQAKFEEADFLGRVMAHSYTQEMQKIGEMVMDHDSSTKAKPDGFRGGAGEQYGPKAPGRARMVAREAKERISALGKRVGGALSSGGKSVGRALVGKDIRRGLHGRRAATGAHATKLRSAANRTLAKGVGKTLGAYGGLAAAGYGGYRALGGGKEKRASAFEKLAEIRAQEILDNAEGDAYEGDEDFDGALNDRALEILQENGYDVG
jgi:hypothetical protein